MSTATESKRGGIVLAASLFAHAIVAALVARTELVRPLRAVPAPTLDSVVELDWRADTPAPPVESPASLVAPTPAPVEPRVAAPLVEPKAASVDPTAPSAEPSSEPAAGAPLPSPESAPRAPSLASLGVGKNPFVPGRNDPVPGSDRPAEGAASPGADMAAAKERVEASLRSAAREREAELGLGPEGPVREALGAAMYESNAPVIGRVVFSVAADAKGHVLSVETVSADRTLADYAGMLAIARRKLGQVTLRLPSSAKGARLAVEVTSAWKLPSGHDPGIDFTLFGQSLKKGEGKTATRVEVLPVPKVLCTEVQESKSGVKVPTCILNAPIVATDGDPADIGAKPRRIVGTKVLERTVL